MHSRAVSVLLLAFVVTVLLVSSMPTATVSYSGIASYIDFQPEASQWLYNPQVCPPLVSEERLDFRNHYRWTTFCGDLGPYRGAAGCRKCLEVTNVVADDTAVPVRLRIIDICDKVDNEVVLQMDKVVFDQIATDGEGSAFGGPGDAQITVNYQEVDCQDPDPIS